MVSIEELKKEISRQRKLKLELEEKRKLDLQRRELEKELSLLQNPRKADAIDGLKKQGRFITGIFKKIYDAVPDPHAPKQIKNTK
jgi:hypothetical protein